MVMATPDGNEAHGSVLKLARRGYDPAQVDEHLGRVDGELRRMAAERDAAIADVRELERQLEKAQSSNKELSSQVNRLSQAPTTIEGLSERLERMLKLAQDEADEIKASAAAESEEFAAKVEAETKSLKERHDQAVAELTAARASHDGDQRKTLIDAKERAAALMSAVEEQSNLAELDSKARRQQAEEDLEISLSSRRTEIMRTLAEAEATSKTEAERRRREATEESRRLVHEANEAAEQRLRDAAEKANRRLQEAMDEAGNRLRTATDESNKRVNEAQQAVNDLMQIRGQLAGQVRVAKSLFSQAEPLLEAHDEQSAAQASADWAQHRTEVQDADGAVPVPREAKHAQPVTTD
ncbi:chromosome segregation protein [Pseudonocardiaceae bacterium YIM PH 21723]|nr:chromosome segregation protein [Pseudonocardiaceae bacterium YIM PH 21723]